MDTLIFNDITQPFVEVLNRDAVIVEQVATRVFYYLALIQLVITTLWTMLAGEGLERLFNKLVLQAFSFGFFYGCVEYGGEWMSLIVNGFIELGQASGVGNVNPGNVMSMGLQISGDIIKGVFQWSLLTAFFTGLFCCAVSLAITIIYALIAAEMVIVLVKSYFLVSLSSLFFAFSGNDLTRELTVKYFKTVLGIGLQLMTLYFLVGVGQALGAKWEVMIAHALATVDLMSILAVFASVIIYYLIVKNIPVFVAGLAGVGGFRTYGESAIATSLMVGAMGASMFYQAQKLAQTFGNDKSGAKNSNFEPRKPKENVPSVSPPSKGNNKS